MPQNHEIRLVAMDLDGTLVTGGHIIPERNAQAIAEARRRGVHIILASGRMHHSTTEFALRLGLDDEPIISYNGAMVKTAETGELLLHDPVPADLADEILGYCVAKGLHIHYYLDDVMYVTRMSHYAIDYYERTGSVPVPVGDVRRFSGNAPTKVLVLAPPDEAEALLDEGRRRWEDRVYVTRSLPEYVEYLNPTATKGRALEFVAEHLGIPLDATLACGDMINDQPMVEVAGIGVAMAHSPEPVRAVADYVTSEGTEGVAEAIEKLVLNRQ
jgi:Cof subfamily protein (haloacid dehalogenase superfamily)